MRIPINIEYDTEDETFAVWAGASPERGVCVSDDDLRDAIYFFTMALKNAIERKEIKWV